MFPMTREPGAFSLTTLNVCSTEGSSMAILWLPTPIPMPISSATEARVVLSSLA